MNMNSLKRYVVVADASSADGHAHVLDRVARGVSNTYTIHECLMLARWLNWRDAGYPERRSAPR